MRTNIEIDDALMADAMEALDVTTKREAVQKALEAAVRAYRQLKAWDELRGSGWIGDLDEMRIDKSMPSHG